MKDLLHKHIKGMSDLEAADFERWLISDAWNRYKEYRMNLETLARSTVESCKISIPNGSQFKKYGPVELVLPTENVASYAFSNLDELGLSVEEIAFGHYSISGTPQVSGDFSIEIEYTFPGWFEGLPKQKRLIPFAVNADPRTLWKNIPTPEDVEYFKPDTVCEYVKVEDPEGGAPLKDMVAASYRGRSHARDGRPRDDHFALHYCQDSGWYVMVVADGAGSAPYSRKGSELACNAVIEHCTGYLENSAEFEKTILEYSNNNEQGIKAVSNKVYEIVGNAAFKAHQSVVKFAIDNQRMPKEYATTLLFAICKKFDFGWFIASYWVGDGAMCLYDAESNTAKLLGEPDEGEYSGQTRFLTMPEIFADHSAIYKRLRMTIVPDFTALMLMTDGVSDPMFGTDVRLKSAECWNQLWATLKSGFPDDGIEGVDLSDNNEQAKDQLLKWLEFWVPGEHDDRTIALLY